MALTNLTKGTVVGSEGGSATTNLAQGLAKAWCSYNGSGTTFADSFNMTSATDNSAGNFTFTIANDMANANYAATSIVHPLTSTSPALHTCEVDCSSGYLAGSLRVEVAYGTTTNSRQEFDAVKCAVTFHGDLA
tara:strand:+ start:2630 stop:3031 length:402 start_codon:yes stop_codon:yes gene_type:complete